MKKKYLERKIKMRDNFNILSWKEHFKLKLNINIAFCYKYEDMLKKLRPHGTLVRSLDYESAGLGSNPGLDSRHSAHPAVSWGNGREKQFGDEH